MNNRGFTLIEILAVLAIFGIILYIAIPKVIDLDSKSNEIVEKFENTSDERVDFVDKLNQKMEELNGK